MDVTYLDYNASTPLPKDVHSFAVDLLETTAGNPSSLHLLGRRSRRIINDATEAVARYIGCSHHQIFWTSGAAEGNSWVIKSAVEKASQENALEKPRLIFSKIEHDSNLLCAQDLEEKGLVTIAYVNILSTGVVDLDHLQELLQTPAALVSILYANNETGVIQPIAEISEMCRKTNTPFHSDCVQVLGKLPLNLKDSGLTYATFSGHKIGAPKGVGFVVALGKGHILRTMIHGKQQKELRGGTENPFGIGLLGRILDLTRQKKLSLFPDQLRQWHSDFEANLCELFPDVVIHGKNASRILNTTYFGFEGMNGDSLLMNLDLEHICGSSGSACSSGSTDPSHVLLAMGLNPGISRSSVRLSSGHQTQWADFQKALNVLEVIVPRLSSKTMVI